MGKTCFQSSMIPRFSGALKTSAGPDPKEPLEPTQKRTVFRQQVPAQLHLHPSPGHATRSRNGILGRRERWAIGHRRASWAFGGSTDGADRR
jgi:hypothetical protein